MAENNSGQTDRDDIDYRESESSSRSENVDRGITPVTSRKRSAPKGILVIGAITIAAIVLVNWNAIFGGSETESADQPQAVGVPEDTNNSNVSDLELPDAKPDEPVDVPEREPAIVESGGPRVPRQANQSGGHKGPIDPSIRKMQGGVFAYGASGHGGSADGANGDSHNATPGRGQSYDSAARDIVQTDNAGTSNSSGAGTSMASMGGSGDRSDESQGGGSRSPISQALKIDDLKAETASTLDHPSFMITQGQMLPCTMITAISSDVSGMVSCSLSRDVYSTNGKVVLLDRGSRLIGQYQGGLTQGQARVFVIWSRAETPEGVIVKLGSPGTDALGRSGLDGRVDRHFWQRFGGALLVSVIDDLGQYLANVAQDGDNTVISLGGSGGGGGAQNEVTTVLEHTIDIPPTLRKHQGDDINVFVARDLDFSQVYDLRVSR